MKQIGTRGRRRKSDERVDDRKTMEWCGWHGMVMKNGKAGEEVEGVLVGQKRRREE
jgi:hypothetical protein